MEGNDHKEPAARRVRPDDAGIRRVEESMGQCGERSISQGEMTTAKAGQESGGRMRHPR